jgi:hypothetical protein
MAPKNLSLPADLHHNHKAMIRILIEVNCRMRAKYASKPAPSEQPKTKTKNK